jgi:hypothetical protein
MLANIAEINSGFFTGNFQPRLNIYVGIAIMGLGAFLFTAGVRLYKNRFISLIGPYGLQPGKERSVHWVKISGTCPICSGELTLRDIGPKENKVKMVVCKINHDHQWRFDPTVLREIE